MPQHIPARNSLYYPPRAGGLRRVRRWRRPLRAGLDHLGRIHAPSLRRLREGVVSALVPGAVFRFRGPRWVARVIWIGLPGLGVIFLAGLGTWVAELAFGLIISAHVVSVSHLLRPWLIRTRLALQMIFGVLLFAAVSLVLYIPARDWFHQHLAVALRVPEGSVVVNPRTRSGTIRRGDPVAYRIHASSAEGVVVREGFGLRPVWGMPGDRIQFEENSVLVNGAARDLPGASPDWEGFVVPEECWFIWPEFHRVTHGAAAVPGVLDRLRATAIVEQRDLVGRPYSWWFFRPQRST